MADEHPWISNRILRRLIDLSRGISALPPSTARGVCGHDRFRLLLDAESPSCADLLSALDNTWHGRPSFRDLPVQAIVVGEDGVGTLLTLLWKVGADELAKEEQENADSVDGRLLALFRAVDGRLNLEGEDTSTQSEISPKEDVYDPNPKPKHAPPKFRQPTGQQLASPMTSATAAKAPARCALMSVARFLYETEPSYSTSAAVSRPVESVSAKGNRRSGGFSSNARAQGSPEASTFAPAGPSRARHHSSSTTRSATSNYSPPRRQRSHSRELGSEQHNRSSPTLPAKRARVEVDDKPDLVFMDCDDSLSYVWENESEVWAPRVVMAKYPDSWGWWPSIAVDPNSEKEWWWSKVEGTRTNESRLVKCIPAGGDWRWNASRDVRALMDSDAVPSNIKEDEDQELYKKGLAIARNASEFRILATKPTDAEVEDETKWRKGEEKKKKKKKKEKK